MRLDALGFMASEASGSGAVAAGLSSAAAEGHTRPHHPLSFKLRFCAEREPGRSDVSLVKPLGLRQYCELRFGLSISTVATPYFRYNTELNLIHSGNGDRQVLRAWRGGGHGRRRRRGTTARARHFPARPEGQVRSARADFARVSATGDGGAEGWRGGSGRALIK